MTDMLDEFDFTGSMGAEVAKESNKGGDFQRELEFLTLKADAASISQGKHQAIIRLVTEYERKPHMEGFPPVAQALPWLTVAQHYAPTKAKPPYAKEQQRWPEKMFAVCRKDKVFAKKYGGTCTICDQGHKASDRSWALAVEREQVTENGRIIGIRDKTREVLDFGPDGKPILLSQDGDKKTYQKKIVPAWVILNFGWKNFFNGLSGQASYFKTILGRDYVVQRSGTGNNDTNYTFIALDPITMTGDWAQAMGVQDGTPYDLGLVVGQAENGRPITLAERVYPDMPDLRRIVAERTSEEYYGRWFIPGWVPEGFDPNAQGNSGGVQNGVQSGYVAPMGGFQQQPAAPQVPQGAAPQAQGQQQPQQGYQQPQQAPQGGPTPEGLDALRARVTGQTAPQAEQGQEQPAQGQQQPQFAAPTQ